ncbi:MAG TPA: DNA-directed RNA polymerase subunit alpha [Acidimicrobiales bacterium]|nr:DNA-directed RNA polymerase subunit alpha [Acidimicrobiales bacterium]
MLIIQRPTIEALGEEEANRQSFAVGPLDPGFGHTLGNSLRRTLLSSIPGAAATRVKFDAVLHEFGVIEGVKEDVQDVCLNLKDLLLRVHSDEPVTLHLDKRGEGAVTAADLSTTADVEVLNGDLHLAYLTTPKSALAFELTVERGKGYVGAEGNKGASTIGVIPLDAIFSPVRRVSFQIEPVRVDQSRDFDRLVIDVETDGSISPREALASAAKTLGSLVDLIARFDEEAPALELGDVGLAQAQASELDIRIEELGLTERSRNCLKRAGINTIAQLVNATERDLTSITNFGATSLKDVTDRLAERGLSLRVEE